eukprot:1160926-Pelagomonas_calceolata.AAC.10
MCYAAGMAPHRGLAQLYDPILSYHLSYPSPQMAPYLPAIHHDNNKLYPFLILVELVSPAAISQSLGL